MPRSTVRLYYRDGCHLCEALASVLYRGWPAQTTTLEWCDVDSRPEWRDRFGLRVPVLTVGDDVVCELQPDTARIVRYFGEPLNPL